jgi:hypothetical protein
LHTNLVKSLLCLKSSWLPIPTGQSGLVALKPLPSTYLPWFIPHFQLLSHLDSWCSKNGGFIVTLYFFPPWFPSVGISFSFPKINFSVNCCFHCEVCSTSSFPQCPSIDVAVLHFQSTLCTSSREHSSLLFHHCLPTRLVLLLPNLSPTTRTVSLTLPFLETMSFPPCPQHLSSQDCQLPKGGLVLDHCYTSSTSQQVLNRGLRKE